MRIAIARPPNYDEIIRVMPQVARWRGVIFCYGDTIYNPHGIFVPPELHAHEGVHSVRQNGNPDAWWDQYLKDKQFRFAEELEGYAAQYRYVLANASCRQVRRRALKDIGQQLASPIYGNLVSPAKACAFLQERAAA